MKTRLVISLLIYSATHFNVIAQDVPTQQKLPIVVKGHFPDLNPGDSLEIKSSLLKYGLNASYVKKSIKVGREPFVIKYDSVDVPSRIDVRVNSYRGNVPMILLLTPLLLIEPNDTIEITKNGSNITYRSRDKKFELLEMIRDKGTELRNRRWSINNEMRPTKKDYNYLDSVTLVELYNLEKIKDRISLAAYHITKIDILSSNQGLKRSAERRLINKDNYLKFQNAPYHPDPAYPDFVSIKDSLAGYHDNLADELDKVSVLNSKYLPYAHSISLYRLNYERDSCIIPNSPFDLKKYYYYLKTNFSGLVREKLVVSLIFGNVHKIGDRGVIIRDALSYIKNNDFRSYLLNLNSGIKGDPAYKFALSDLKGNIVKMESFKGKIIIMDFWGTGCGPCILLHPKFDKVVDHFSGNANVIFISLNIDQKSSDWKASVAGGKYTCTSKPNLLNINIGELGSNHPMLKYHNIRAYPTLLIVNAEGNVEDNPLDPWSDNGKGLINKIESLLLITKSEFD